ncbi:hypothetical protein Bca4012_006110 [Brassica carinata]
MTTLAQRNVKFRSQRNGSRSSLRVRTYDEEYVLKRKLRSRVLNRHSRVGCQVVLRQEFQGMVVAGPEAKPWDIAVQTGQKKTSNGEPLASESTPLLSTAASSFHSSSALSSFRSSAVLIGHFWVLILLLIDTD